MVSSSAVPSAPSDLCLVVPPLPAPWPTFAAPLSLGVMASGTGTNLEALATAIQRGDLHAQIRLVVYNNPDAPVAQRAARLGIPALLLDHRTYSSREALDRAIIVALQSHGVEWVIMAGWMRRVTSVLIEAFPQRILNIHPSLLPSFPGLHAVEQALAAQVAIAGCTVHHVVEAVDSGPIVMQAAVPVQPTDTAASLQARIQVQEHRIFPAAIALAASQSPTV